MDETDSRNVDAMVKYGNGLIPAFTDDNKEAWIELCTELEGIRLVLQQIEKHLRR